MSQSNQSKIVYTPLEFGIKELDSSRYMTELYGIKWRMVCFTAWCIGKEMLQFSTSDQCMITLAWSIYGKHPV